MGIFDDDEKYGEELGSDWEDEAPEDEEEELEF